MPNQKSTLMSRRHVLTAIIIIACATVIAPLASRAIKANRTYLQVSTPAKAIVFDRWEATVSFKDELSEFRTLPGTQVNDAYDADRNGQFVRLRIRFDHSSGHTMTVPGFAMKEAIDGLWQHKVRWSPDREGVWSATVLFDGSAGNDIISFSQPLPDVITAKTVGLEGSLIPPEKNNNQRYLRQKMPDGTSKAIMLYGTCRAWTVRQPDPKSIWGNNELIDRERELFAPMRAHGMNLLSQWMAPWEYSLVHHGQAEYWERQDGTFSKADIAERDEWSSHQYYDQGRASAFDKLIEQCEGDQNTPTIRLFLAPLPHPLFRNTSHPWSEGYGFWSPWENPDLPAGNMNGFCTSEDMESWDFFDADPRYPLTDERSMRFDHQANFFRYLIARWGYSRALGAWVILDEIEGIGDEEAYLPERTGFWEHKQCQRWLDDMIRLFNGRLKRVADDMPYAGDPYNHPTSAATSSVRGDYQRGSNLDWAGGDPDALPDVQGWHWYPPLSPPITNWWKAWNLTLAGVMNFNSSPIGDRARLISEFGSEDRQSPYFTPSYLYPSIYHFSAWASALSGQAGTVMDWNDGKSYGEFFPKNSPAFTGKAYPIAPAKSLGPLQEFMSRLDLDILHPINQRGGLMRCRMLENGVIAGLTSDNADRLYAWIFSPDTRHDTKLEILGLQPGTYFVTVYDTWVGKTRTVSLIVNSEDTPTVLNVQKWLYDLDQPGTFPNSTRNYRGHDLAIAITPATVKD